MKSELRRSAGGRNGLLMLYSFSTWSLYRMSFSTLRTPCSMARRAQASAASWAAKGVDLREPLKPTLPAEAHDRTLPSWSVKLMIVLLKLDLMWATP